MERLLLASEVAQILGVRPCRLARWRREKRGPQFIRVGPHPRYRTKDLIEWMESQSIRTELNMQPSAQATTEHARGRESSKPEDGNSPRWKNKSNACDQ